MARVVSWPVLRMAVGKKAASDRRDVDGAEQHACLKNADLRRLALNDGATFASNRQRWIQNDRVARDQAVEKVAQHGEVLLAGGDADELESSLFRPSEKLVDGGRRHDCRDSTTAPS
jgi:hypothetical protein